MVDITLGKKRVKMACIGIFQAIVVRRVDSAIHCIIRLVLFVFIRRMVSYPVDNVIQLLENRAHYISLCNTPFSKAKIIAGEDAEEASESKIKFKFSFFVLA